MRIPTQAVAHPKDSGIHASYFFSPEGIALKIKSFAHKEFDRPEFVEIPAIKERIKTNQPPDYRKRDVVDNDPARDLAVMAFKPAARALLLAQSKELRRLQGA